MAVKKPVFKPYHQNQLIALPSSLDDLIPADPVRIVNDVINAINVEPLLKAYHVRGGSNYHLLLLLKVLVYAYVTNIYSSRKLAEACRERVPFMWLSAMNKPDHNPINHFRVIRITKNTLLPLISCFTMSSWTFISAPWASRCIT